MTSTAPPPIPDGMFSLSMDTVINALGQPLGTVFVLFASTYVGAAVIFMGARLKLGSIWSNNASWREKLYFFVLPSNPMPKLDVTTSGPAGPRRLAATSDAGIFFQSDPQDIRGLNEKCITLTSRGIFHEIFTNRMRKYVWLITGLVLQTILFLITWAILFSAHGSIDAEVSTIVKIVASWPFVYAGFVWLLVHIVQDWLNDVAATNRKYTELDRAPYEVVELR